MWFHLRSGPIRFPDGLHEHSIREAKCVNLRPSFRVKTIRVTSPNLNRPSYLIKYFFYLSRVTSKRGKRTKSRPALAEPTMCFGFRVGRWHQGRWRHLLEYLVRSASHRCATAVVLPLVSRVAREAAPETMCGIHGIHDSALSMSSKQLSYTSEGMFCPSGIIRLRQYSRKFYSRERTDPDVVRVPRREKRWRWRLRLCQQASADPSTLMPLEAGHA